MSKSDTNEDLYGNFEDIYEAELTPLQLAALNGDNKTIEAFSPISVRDDL